MLIHPIGSLKTTNVKLVVAIRWIVLKVRHLGNENVYKVSCQTTFHVVILNQN